MAVTDDGFTRPAQQGSAFMDELRRHATSLIDRWQRLARRQRIAMIAVLVTSAVGFLCLMSKRERDWQPICGGREFTSRELAAIQSVWRERGLNEFRRDGHQLSVPVADLARYESAVPKTKADEASSGNEWEKQLVGVNVFTSPDELAQRKDNALRNELRRVLKGIPAIAEADVIWARGKSRSAFSARSKVTATINVTPREGFDLTPELAQSLRTAVAGMVPDLAAEDIAILDQSTGLAITQGSAELIVEQQLRRQQERLARQLESRIAAALTHIPNATVQAKLVEVSQPQNRHLAAKPTFGSAIVWTPEANENWVEFSPFIGAEHDSQTPPQTSGSDRSVAWQVIVQIPDSYFDAHAAQQLLSADRRAANLDDLRDAECARVRQLVRNVMPRGATLAELSIVPAAGTVATASAVPFAAWPHVVCSFFAVLCLTFAARRRRAEDVNPPSDLSLVQSSLDTEPFGGLTPSARQEVAEESSALAPQAHAEPSSVLTRLRQLDPQSLADLLRHERPQAIAVLLTRFPTRIASACLSRFTSSLQTEVIRRLKSLGEVSDELVDEIACAVCQRMVSPVEPVTHEPTNRIAHLLPETPTQRAFA